MIRSLPREREAITDRRTQLRGDEDGRRGKADARPQGRTNRSIVP